MLEGTQHENTWINDHSFHMVFVCNQNRGLTSKRSSRSASVSCDNFILVNSTQPLPVGMNLSNMTFKNHIVYIRIQNISRSVEIAELFRDWLSDRQLYESCLQVRSSWIYCSSTVSEWNFELWFTVLARRTAHFQARQRELINSNFCSKSQSLHNPITFCNFLLQYILQHAIFCACLFRTSYFLHLPISKDCVQLLPF